MSDASSDPAKDSKLAFLDEQPSSLRIDAASIAVGRKQKQLREIDAGFLLEVAAKFASHDDSSEDGSETETSSTRSSDGPSETTPPNGSLTGALESTLSNIVMPKVGSPHAATSGPNSAPPALLTTVEHHSRVLVVGPPGSGKTTFRHSVSQVIRMKPDVQPSSHSASNVVHYTTKATPTRPSEKLYVDLVDSGPLQQSGLARYYAPADLVILMWSLATVKQVKKSTGFLKSTEAVVFHPNDIQAIGAMVREITVALPGVPLVVVGTHKDVLSARNAESVARVAKELESVVNDAIDRLANGHASYLATSTVASETATPTRGTLARGGGFPTSETPSREGDAAPCRRLNPPLLLATYAASFEDSKAVPVMGGQLTVGTMWRSICDSILKGVRGDPVMRSIDLPRLHFFDHISEFGATVRNVRNFLTCLRAEHGIVLLGMHQLSQALFAFGAPSKAVAHRILHVLHHRGEVVVLRKTRACPTQVLLLPHLPSRIIATTLAVAMAMHAPVEERLGRTKLVNVGDCLSADQMRDLARGTLRKPTLTHIATCVPSDVAQDRTLVFTRVARQVGFLFRLRTAASTFSDAIPGGSASFNGSTVNTMDKFIIPTLLCNLASPTTVLALRKEAVAGKMHVAGRVLTVPLAPSGFIGQLQCELGYLVVQRTHLTRTTAWLSRGDCRCLMTASKDPRALPDALSLDFLFFSATGPRSLRTFSMFVSDVIADAGDVLASARISHTAKVVASHPMADSGSSGLEGTQGLQIQEAPMVTPSDAPRDDSLASLLRLDLSVAPLNPSA